jgi:hypothetical protein
MRNQVLSFMHTLSDAHVNTGRVTFHSGMVHDLCFKQSQQRNQNIEFFVPDIPYKPCTFTLPHSRPMQTIEASSDEECISPAILYCNLKTTPTFGFVSASQPYTSPGFLGATNRAIQVIVDEGLPRDNLLWYLEDVVEGRPCDNVVTSHNVIAKPAYHPAQRHAARFLGHTF